MDRNEWIKAQYPGCRFVALRKESVDRNTHNTQAMEGGIRSLSARRAWIEIICHLIPNSGTLSLSARRAWIEIPALLSNDQNAGVALRKESVDRNFYYADKDCDWVVALRKESVDRNACIGFH